MKYYEDYKPSNYLNEYSYEQIKRTNQIALDILNEFVDEMFIMFLNIKTYIVKPYKLNLRPFIININKSYNFHLKKSNNLLKNRIMGISITGILYNSILLHICNSLYWKFNLLNFAYTSKNSLNSNLSNTLVLKFL